MTPAAERAPPPRTLVLDYEPAWARECAAVEVAVQQALGRHYQCEFGPVDITLPIDAPANEQLMDAAATLHLLLASYVIAENARALEASGFAFFETLFAKLPDKAMVLVLETTHRSFGGVVRAAQRGLKASLGGGLQIACPHDRVGP